MVLPCLETFSEVFEASQRYLPPHHALVPACGPHPAMPQPHRTLPLFGLESILEHQGFNPEFFLSAYFLAPCEEKVEGGHVGSVVQDLRLRTLPHKFREPPVLPEQPPRFLMRRSGDLRYFDLGLLLPSGKLRPLGEASEDREEAGEHAVHPACPGHIPREPPDLIEPGLRHALFHGEPEESEAALPLCDIPPPLGQEVPQPRGVMGSLHPREDGRQAPAVLAFQTDVVGHLFRDLRAVELCLDLVLIQIRFFRALHTLDDSSLIVTLCQQLPLPDLDGSVLHPFSEGEGEISLLAVQYRVFKGRLRPLEIDGRLPPPLEEILLRHVVAALERQRKDFLASQPVLICQGLICLVLLLCVVRELADGGDSISQVGHDAVLCVFQGLFSLHLHVFVPHAVNLILASEFDRIHHLHELLLQPLPVLGVRDKLFEERLNQALGKEGPGLSAPLVPFDVLDNEVSLFTVLEEGQALQAALILDELAVQHLYLVYLRLHVALPLGEFDLDMPVECVHDQLLQSFACLDLLPVLLIPYHSLLALYHAQQLPVPGLPRAIRDAPLLLEDLQCPEIDPPREGLVDHPLIPIDHLLPHVPRLETFRELRVPPPLLEVLVKDLALEAREVFDGLRFLVPQTLPLPLQGVQLAELSPRDLLFEKLLGYPLEYLLLLVVPERVEADLGYIFGPPQPGLLVRESLVSPHLLSKHNRGLE